MRQTDYRMENIGNRQVSLAHSNAAATAQLLEKNGFLPARGILSGGLAHECAESIDAEFDCARQDPTRFGDINGGRNRRDLLLRMTGPVLEAAIEVGRAISPLLDRRSTLEELSCLIVDEGADAQAIHPDTPFDDDECSAVSLIGDKNLQC